MKFLSGTFESIIFMETEYETQGILLKKYLKDPKITLVDYYKFEGMHWVNSIGETFSTKEIEEMLSELTFANNPTINDEDKKCSQIYGLMIWNERDCILNIDTNGLVHPHFVPTARFSTVNWDGWKLESENNRGFSIRKEINKYNSLLVTIDENKSDYVSFNDYDSWDFWKANIILSLELSDNFIDIATILRRRHFKKMPNLNHWSFGKVFVELNGESSEPVLEIVQNEVLKLSDKLFENSTWEVPNPFTEGSVS